MRCCILVICMVLPSESAIADLVNFGFRSEVKSDWDSEIEPIETLQASVKRTVERSCLDTTTASSTKVFASWGVDSTIDDELAILGDSEWGTPEMPLSPFLDSGVQADLKYSFN